MRRSRKGKRKMKRRKRRRKRRRRRRMERGKNSKKEKNIKRKTSLLYSFPGFKCIYFFGCKHFSFLTKPKINKIKIKIK